VDLAHLLGPLLLQQLQRDLALLRRDDANAVEAANASPTRKSGNLVGLNIHLQVSTIGTDEIPRITALHRIGSGCDRSPTRHLATLWRISWSLAHSGLGSLLFEAAQENLQRQKRRLLARSPVENKPHDLAVYFESLTWSAQ
jgi:hypothetical protein